MILWSVLYLEGEQLSVQGERPMMCLDQLDRWSIRTHRPGLLASGALIEEDKVLLGSEVLDEMEKMVLFSAALARSWCFLGLSF